MHQSSTPSLSQTIFYPRWESRQFLALPIVQTLLPVTFAYSLSSEAVVMRQLRRWKSCDESHWHAHTRGLPWDLPEVVGTVQQVHYSRRRLLRRGLEFHVCTINKSAHTKKKNGNLYYDPRMLNFSFLKRSVTQDNPSLSALQIWRFFSLYSTVYEKITTTWELLDLVIVKMRNWQSPSFVDTESTLFKLAPTYTLSPILSSFFL